MSYIFWLHGLVGKWSSIIHTVIYVGANTVWFLKNHKNALTDEANPWGELLSELLMQDRYGNLWLKKYQWIQDWVLVWFKKTMQPKQTREACPKCHASAAFIQAILVVETASRLYDTFNLQKQKVTTHTAKGFVFKYDNYASFSHSISV